MRPTSAAFVLFALLAASCTRYDCAELALFGVPYGEQCGPAGSQGSLYFEDGMATLIIGADFEDFLTEESSVILDYIPTVRISFRSVHLAGGTALGPEQTSVVCGRSIEPFAGYASWSGQASLEVVEPSDRTQTGGQSWRFRWDATCAAEADIRASGDDIVELAVVGSGYDFDLYGVPPDWPL